jgi:multiple antibiotic resistance protein
MDPVFLEALINCFVTIFIIVDPFLGLAVFLSLTEGMDKKGIRKQAAIASGVALGIMLLFLFAGMAILDALGITLSSLKVGGGFVLLLLAVQTVLGVEFGTKKEQRAAAAVIIGTPLLCGPGAITTSIVLSDKFGLFPVLIAIFATMIITFIMLTQASRIHKFLGSRMTEVISRVMG